MLFDSFDEDAKCSKCGRRAGDIARDLETGKVGCQPCMDIVELQTAQQSAFEHLVGCLYSLWNFDFGGVFVQGLWAIQRLTCTGDYGPDGYFTNILKKSALK